MDQLQAKLDAIQAEIDAIDHVPGREMLTGLLEVIGDSIRAHHANKHTKKIVDAVCNGVKGIWDTK